MVLATKVGRKRSFGVGLLLTIVTLGVYAVYWNYKAHNELYRQFELNRENRDEGMVWYVLGLILFPFLLAYLWVFGANVAYLRQRIGLRQATTAGRLTALLGTGIGALAVGLILVEVAFQATGDLESEAVQNAFGTLLVLAIAALVLLAIGYFRLQRDINELWDAYDARMGWLALHPEEFRTPEMSNLAPAAAPEMLASPLRREVEALRARHPQLRALGELDGLMARAEAGDAEARERGEELLGHVAQLLQERAELVALRDAREADMAQLRERLATGTIFEDDIRKQLAELDPVKARERLEVVEAALFAR